MTDKLSPFKDHNHQEIEEEEQLWQLIYKEIPLLSKRIDRALTLHNQSIHGDEVYTIDYYQCEFIQDLFKEFSTVISLLQGKYTIEILFVLYNMVNPYYNQIKEALPDINSNTLSSRLKSLVNDDIIERTVIDTTPIRVTYSLSTNGKMMYLLLYPLFLYQHGLTTHKTTTTNEYPKVERDQS